MSASTPSPTPNPTPGSPSVPTSAPSTQGISAPPHPSRLSWIGRLVAVNPSPGFPWKWTLRFVFSMATILLPAVLLHQQSVAVFMALGTLLNTVTQHPVAYRLNFNQMAIAIPMGAVGYFIGIAAGLNNWAHIFTLAVLAGLSALISTFGSSFSVGSIQMMVLAIVASANVSHLSKSGLPLWVPALLFIAGGLWAALLLGIEALFVRHTPDRIAYAHLLSALANFMDIKQPADRATLAKARIAVIDSSNAAYQNLLQDRLHTQGQSRDNNRRAAMLAAASNVWEQIITGTHDPEVMAQCQTWLAQIAQAVDQDAKTAVPPALSPAQIQGLSANDLQLYHSIVLVSDLYWRYSGLSDETASTLASADVKAAEWLGACDHRPSWQTTLRAAFSFGSSAWANAARLTLTVGVGAWAASELSTHSFWIPLLIVTIMKPDFGSVFVRAVQRTLGTVLGAALGVALFWALPIHGWWLPIITVLLCFPILWGSLKGFWVMTLFLTPMILALVQMVSGTDARILAWDRVVDTAIAGALVLLFGYVLWPQSFRTKIRSYYKAVLCRISDFFQAATAANPNPYQVAKDRDACYRQLSDLHIQLQRSLAEPPPASTDAQSWFPVVATLGRLTDVCAAYSSQRNSGKIADLSPLSDAQIQLRVQALEQASNLETLREQTPIQLPADAPGMADIDSQIRQLQTLIRADR